MEQPAPRRWKASALQIPAAAAPANGAPPSAAARGGDSPFDVASDGSDEEELSLCEAVAAGDEAAVRRQLASGARPDAVGDIK